MSEFGWNLPEVIVLPHELPPIDTAEYHKAAENIVAAYRAGAHGRDHYARALKLISKQDRKADANCRVIAEEALGF